jgi:molecular chaperone GrpE
MANKLLHTLRLKMDNMAKRNKAKKAEIKEEELKNQTEEGQEEAAEDQDSQDQISEAEEWQNKYQEINDKYLRLYSEFDNFRKRTAKERLDVIQSASKDVLSELIPILDDFERSMASFEDAKEVEPLKEGVRLVHGKLFGVMEKQGFKYMEVKAGDEFDAELHEAITKIPAPTEDLKGKIVDVLERGCLLHDKVLRFPKVVIGE